MYVCVRCATSSFIEPACTCASDLSRRVDTVKEENLKLKSENLVLGQYIENLMEASAIFQSTVPHMKKSVVICSTSVTN